MLVHAKQNHNLDKTTQKNGYRVYALAVFLYVYNEEFNQTEKEVILILLPLRLRQIR